MLITLPLSLHMNFGISALTFKTSVFLYVIENRVLRRIFGPYRDEVKGEWRKLHNEELNDLSSSPGE